MTALDIIVLLLVGAGLVFGCAARLRRRGAVALRLDPGDRRAQAAPRAGRRRAGRRRSAPAPAPRCSPSSWSSASSSSPASSPRAGSAARARNSVVGPVDRVLGAGFGALKGLIGATLLYLAAQPGLRHDLRPRAPRGRNGWPSRAPILCSTRAARADRRLRRGAARRRRPTANATEATSRERANDRDPAARHDGAGEARLRARRSERG